MNLNETAEAFATALISASQEGNQPRDLTLPEMPWGSPEQRELWQLINDKCEAAGLDVVWTCYASTRVRSVELEAV